MATVKVEVNGRPYNVGCADGQEDRVRALAGQFDGLVRQVAGDVGHVGDIRLFLMAALVLADELHETRTGAARKKGAPPPTLESPAASDGVAEALNAVAARIEKIVRAI